MFTTPVLDNGINIKDEQVKHVFIELYDLTEFIQCLGRKRRIDEEDTITLYFLDYTHYLNLIYNKHKSMLEIYDEGYQKLSKEEFWVLYRRRDVTSIFDNCGTPIIPAIEKLRADCLFMEKILNGECSFSDCVRQKINKPVVYYRTAKKSVDLSAFLADFVGKEIYKAEQKIIINEIAFKRNGKLIKRPELLNSFLKEHNVPYEIVSHPDASRNKPTYWTVEPLVD